MPKTYTEEQVTEYLELAMEVGIGKAMRTLGYPASAHTAYKWADQRKVDLTKAAQQRAAVMSRYLMDDMEEIQVAQTGIERVAEELFTNTNLSADEHYKLSQALAKHVGTKQLLLGKVTSRTEQIHKDSVQNEIDALMNEFNQSQENAESAPPAEIAVEPVEN